MYFKEYRHYNLSHGDPIQILRVAGFAGGMLLIFFGIFVLALSAREGGGDEKNRPSVGDDHAAGEASKGRDRMQSTSNLFAFDASDDEEDTQRYDTEAGSVRRGRGRADTRERRAHSLSVTALRRFEASATAAAGHAVQPRHALEVEDHRDSAVENGVRRARSLSGTWRAIAPTTTPFPPPFLTFLHTYMNCTTAGDFVQRREAASRAVAQRQRAESHVRMMSTSGVEAGAEIVGLGARIARAASGWWGE